jgi:hypothetical protein
MKRKKFIPLEGIRLGSESFSAGPEFHFICKTCREIFRPRCQFSDRERELWRELGENGTKIDLYDCANCRTQTIPALKQQLREYQSELWQQQRRVFNMLKTMRELEQYIERSEALG